MSDGTGLAEALLGLPGFRVLEVTETTKEVVVVVETVADLVGCERCGTRATAHDRMRVDVRDLPCFGRPARLVWHKRRWRCREPLCDAKTWTEASPVLDRQAVITRRAGAEACRQGGELARPVAEVAEELGVCCWTVMNVVVEHGTPLVEDPDLVGQVRHLGVDETSFLAANRHHSTIYATGLVDLQRRIVIDLIEGNRDEPVAQPGGGLEVVDAQQRVVVADIADAGLVELAAQPLPAVDVDLDPMGDPALDADVHQPELGIHEIQVVVQTLRFASGHVDALGLVVAAHLERPAALHRADHTDHALGQAVPLGDRSGQVLLAGDAPRTWTVAR